MFRFDEMLLGNTNVRGRRMLAGNAPIITIALVLYKRKALDSESFATLLEILDADPMLREHFRLVIFDNSPETHLAPPCPIPLTFVGDTSNPGLAAPYNEALGLADRSGSTWLLLLDQDTKLTHAFLTELCDATTVAPVAVAAIVPKLMGPRGLKSPLPVPWLNVRPLDSSFTGVVNRKVMAFNSGACLKVSAVREVGGFPREFWLDYLDHAVFHLLQRAGGRVQVLSAVLTHDLSLDDLKNKGSHSRFANLLAAERRYYRMYGSRTQKALARLRLLKESLLIALGRQNMPYARMCFWSAVRFFDTGDH